jgi:hypothetical protein
VTREHDRERLIVKYLLGELPRWERAQFEREYFADDSLYDEVRAVEAELFDDYSRNNLPERERRLFEQNLLRSPEAFRKLNSSRTLLEALSSDPDEPLRPDRSDAVARPLPAFFHTKLGAASAVAAVVLLMLCAALALFTFKRHGDPPRPGPEHVAQTPPEPSPQQPLAQWTPDAGGAHNSSSQPSDSPPSNRRTTQHPALLAFTLQPSGTRGQSGGSDGVLIVPWPTQTVSFKLKVEADVYQRYRAIIRTAEGVEVLRLDALRPRATRTGAEVSVQVSTRSLREGDYTLTLSGLVPPDRYADIDDYFFSIVRE